MPNTNSFGLNLQKDIFEFKAKKKYGIFTFKDQCILYTIKLISKCEIIDKKV